MPRVRKSSTATSLLVSAGVHTGVIVVIFVVAAKTGLIPNRFIPITALRPEKKPDEKPPEPPKDVPPSKEEVAQAKTDAPPPPSNEPPPTTAPPTVKAADPSAPAIGGASAFGADVRQPGAQRAPVVQAQSKPGTGTKAPATVVPSTTAPSAFSAEATKPSTVESVLEERKSSVTVQDSFSREQITRSAARDAGEVVAKITGASVVDGKVAVVRGLSDRYTTTVLNGADVPSADAYRKSVQLDMFTANMIDRVVTTKTFTPDQPGGFAGGAINIVTKSFPEKAFAELSLGVGYNTQASLNDGFLTYDGGKSDWTAMDDGAREMPAGLGPEAGSLFNGPFKTPEEAQVALNRAAAFNPAFGPIRGSSPINNSFSFSFGETTVVADRPFGVFGGMSYSRTFNHYSGGVQARYDDRLVPLVIYDDTQSRMEVDWSLTGSVAWQLSPEHELGFSVLHNRSAEDQVRHRESPVLEDGFNNRPEEKIVREVLNWTERSLTNFQLKGRHGFEAALPANLEWLGSMSETAQQEPDVRYFNYGRTDRGDGTSDVAFGANNLPVPFFPQRVFRDLEESNRNAKADLRIPFDQWSGETAEFKVGVFGSVSERNFNERTFSFTGQSGWGFNDDPNTYLAPRNFGIITNSLPVPPFTKSYAITRPVSTGNGTQTYDGEQDVRATYAMLDLPLVSRFHLIGGARLEVTKLTVTGQTPSPDITDKDSDISQTDVLPALGFLWKLAPDVNLRANWSETIARPTFREIAPYESYDPLGDELVVGNPGLKFSSIRNFDLRAEWFPRPGEVLSVSVFSKEIQNPIEKYYLSLTDAKISFQNRELGKVSGLEFEARKRLDFVDPLLDSFTVGVNAALIRSEVELTFVEYINKAGSFPDTEPTRPLFDQSPYIVNLDLTYENPVTATTVSLLANLTGERIFLTSPTTPDIFEHPPVQLDATVEQRVRHDLKIRLSARNLLDSPFLRTYGESADGPVFGRYRRGRVFSLSLVYQF